MIYDFVTLKNTFGDRFKENEPLAKYTTLKIGGPADGFIDVKTREELIEVLREARNKAIPRFIMGGGSNILVGDKGFRGLVIKNSANKIVIRGMKGKLTAGNSDSQVYVEADSGVIMNHLVRFTIEEGLAGLEMHLGLPGTVGGAVYMNSKWTRPEGYVGDCVYRAMVMSDDGEIREVEHSYFQFAYDWSILQKTHETVLGVIFSLRKMSREELWKTANESIQYRRLSQPQGVFSPGCTFRNISKVQAFAIPTPNHTTSAGYLIDHAGLKGSVIGDAQVSPVHANFIVNRGKATAADVVQLIDQAKKEVKRKFGVTLEEEIARIGEF